MGKFFDIHTHIGQAANHTPPLTAEELLRWMDANDVAQAAVLPLASPESSSYLITPDFVLAQTKPYRDRLIPFCSIDPRTDYSGGSRGLLGMLTRYVEAGAKGFGEHKTGVAIDDPRNMKLYAACAELKLPVLIHIDNARNMDRPGLPGFAKVLETFPTVNFLGHAFGWWVSLAGGVTQADLGAGPRMTPVAPGGAIDALMDKYPNLYGDLSASSGAAAIRRDMKFGREFLLRRADRLVFGTDYHFPGQAIPQFELYRELDLPPDATQKIFHDNARRLLGLS
ncbi:MAG: amidohydrolase family protein [Planctomycetia bacterium]|nr:amidohydrolase family protein [Planctomycetia bacterium]